MSLQYLQNKPIHSLAEGFTENVDAVLDATNEHVRKLNRKLEAEQGAKDGTRTK